MSVDVIATTRSPLFAVTDAPGSGASPLLTVPRAWQGLGEAAPAGAGAAGGAASCAAGTGHCAATNASAAAVATPNEIVLFLAGEVDISAIGLTTGRKTMFSEKRREPRSGHVKKGWQAARPRP